MRPVSKARSARLAAGIPAKLPRASPRWRPGNFWRSREQHRDSVLPLIPLDTAYKSPRLSSPGVNRLPLSTPQPCCNHSLPARRSNACPELGETFRLARVSRLFRHTTEAPHSRPRPPPNAMSPQRLPCSPRLPPPPRRRPQPALSPARPSIARTRSSAMPSPCSHIASLRWTTASLARMVARSSTR